jgi:hypothetical protein
MPNTYKDDPFGSKDDSFGSKDDSFGGGPGFADLEGEVAVLLAEQSTEERFDLDKWAAKGKELTKRDGEVRWELGKWLLEGEPNVSIPTEHNLNPLPGEGFYSFASSITGLAVGSLRDLASTARRCPATVRTDKLSWSHHRALVNAKPGADAKSLEGWLKRAVEEQMSVAEFKKELKSVGDKPKLTKTILITLPLMVWEALRDEADDDGGDDDVQELTIQQIAANAVIAYVQSDEGVTKRELAKMWTASRRLEQRQKSGRRLARSYPLRDR